MAKREAGEGSGAGEARLYAYDACGTCKKARKWLDERGLAYEVVAIVEHPPQAAALARLVAASGLPARKWFNTSGQSYRALTAALGKSGVDALSEAEIVARLAKDGKLIKRPVLVTARGVLVGFREEAWAAHFA